MENIDALILDAGLSRGAFMVVFIAVVLSQPDESYLWHWLAALVSSTLGSLLLALYPAPAPPPLSIAMLINTCYTASLAFSLSGLRVFYRRRVAPTALLLVLGSPPLLLGATVLPGIPTHVAIGFTCLICALLTALSVLEIARPPRERLYSPWVVALAFAAYCAVLSVTGTLVLLNFISAEMQNSSYSAMLTDRIASILVYFSFIAMACERANLSLRQQAETDPLTGLANRRGAQHVLRRLDRDRAAGAVASVLIGDIDHFKAVNDTLGHDAGDQVIQAFAARIRSVLRQQDIAVRWGGEEFLVLLPRTDLAEALQVAQRLREQIAASPFPAGGQTVAITTSVGVAEARNDARSLQSVISSADDALYRAKREGRNRVCHAPSRHVLPDK
ncbi:GGDEF domain-containing protein [Kushneria aurantia]|uniref:diguanylate cyclase n=1 Tax=Kushneria aurantia TaxID=504092 RepID=A0ABV6G599_9GAMM|nr:GGDEF domain-containing protein [Kushneria aurantia]